MKKIPKTQMREVKDTRYNTQGDKSITKINALRKRNERKVQILSFDIRSEK